MNDRVDQNLDGVSAGRGAAKMLELLEAELSRLKEALEVLRTGDHPERRRLIRQHVAKIDEREDALEVLQASLAAVGKPAKGIDGLKQPS